jgi:hypothetical protein
MYLGGTLICCEMCPASFHADCLKIDPPDGAFLCTNCQHGRRPLFGEVLWVKLGTYRWWPARVLHPSDIPDNIERLAHGVGEFAVMFFGTNEFAWIGLGRCFMYQEGDSDRKVFYKLCNYNLKYKTSDHLNTIKTF